MATLETIYNFEEQLESGFKDLIDAQINVTSYTASAAGTTAANGSYTDSGAVVNTKPVYTNSNDYFLSFDGTKWALYITIGGENNLIYTQLAAAATPDAAAWFVAGGASPAPTFAAATTAPAATYYRRSTATKASPFIDVLVTVGESVEHERYKSSKTTEDMFKGNLALEVHTNRSFNPSDHYSLLSSCRVALLPTEGDYSTATFPNLAILDIRAVETSYEADDDTGLDRTILNFAFTFGIRPAAWPA